MRLPGKLTGTSDLVPWLNALREAIRSGQVLSGVNYRVRQSTEGVVLEAFGGGGGAALKFKLYDPTKACSAGTIYKIRTTDAAAVTGIEVSAETFIKAMPGKFYCLKDVPANPTEAKHIPQLPDGSGQTDPEHANKHWEFITPAMICTANGPVEV
jgi:hypothetical protein